MVDRYLKRVLDHNLPAAITKLYLFWRNSDIKLVAYFFIHVRLDVFGVIISQHFLGFVARSLIDACFISALPLVRGAAIRKVWV